MRLRGAAASCYIFGRRPSITLMRSVLALGLSLALTGALLVMNFVLFRARVGEAPAALDRNTSVTTQRVLRVPAPAPPAVQPHSAPTFHWSALESPDYVVYAAKLRAIGCPERTLRDILLPDIEKLYDAREAGLAADTEDTFWETADASEARQRQRTAKLRALELEKRALIQQLLGAELSYEALKELRAPGFSAAIVEMLLGFTDLAKSDQMLTLHLLRGKDGEAQLAAAEGILLDEDFPPLHALRDRFEGELAGALAPSEMEELRLRLTTLNDMDHLNRRNGVNITGGERREISRLRADTEDMFAKVLDLEDELYPEELRKKGDAAFAELLRRFLGTDRHADSERAQDHLFRELLQSTEKQGVAKAALLQAYESRRTAEKQAEEIRADTQLTQAERGQLLGMLRSQTTQVLARSLGPVGFGAYLTEHGQQLTNSLSMPPTRPRDGTLVR